MIDDPLRLQILTRILESPQFRDSKRSQELLQYLVQASIEQKSPKETTIAVEFFGKDARFDPKEDPTVRVQMNYLRKKLEHYYLTSDDPFPYRLDIPKGHYVVEFIPAPPGRAAVKAAGRTPIIALSLLVVLLSVLAGALWLSRTDRAPSSRPSFSSSPLWAEFLQEGGKPTLIVMGDYFFLFDKTYAGKPGVIVRFPLINSPEDLRAVVRQDPSFAQRYVQSEFTFLRPSASWGIAEILPILRESPRGISLKLASQLTLDDLSTNNIVFIGSFKTLHSLNRILHNFDMRFQLNPASLTLAPPPPDSSVSFLPQNVRGGEYERDYAVIVKGRGPEGNVVLMILGFGDAGVLQGAKAAADPSLTARIEREYGAAAVSSPLYCNLVLEAEGINQTGFRVAFRYFRAHHAPGTPGAAAPAVP